MSCVMYTWLSLLHQVRSVIVLFGTTFWYSGDVCVCWVFCCANLRNNKLRCWQENVTVDERSTLFLICAVVFTMYFACLHVYTLVVLPHSLSVIGSRTCALDLKNVTVT